MSINNLIQIFEGKYEIFLRNGFGQESVIRCFYLCSQRTIQTPKTLLTSLFLHFGTSLVSSSPYTCGLLFKLVSAFNNPIGVQPQLAMTIKQIKIEILMLNLSLLDCKSSHATHLLVLFII